MRASPIDAAQEKVLVVDDAPEFVELVVGLLEREGYDVASARDGGEALIRAEDISPDVVVLDLTLPVLDGIEVCRRLRSFSDAYVIMLTARTDEVDRVIGLEVGADDYMTKPFSPRELVARVKAMLRRPRTASRGDGPSGPSVLGSLTIDPLAREVTRDGDDIDLTRIEFDLLAVLGSEPTRVFSRAQLRELVWGPNWYGDDHVIDVHVANLRRKIDSGAGPSLVRTVRGVGYRMEDVD